ncbi:MULTISPECIES: GIN domain-containing protein [unclassified Myroides]|uniref:GIN domain-containing protein n=1 Tax=unclassified Myroides TaxID=2642485 RepID=UPI003D2F7EB9
MKKLAIIFLLIGSTVLAQKQEKRQVADFSAVKVSSSIQLDFTYGGSKSVAVEVEDAKDMEYVKTEVKNGVLQVYFETPKGMINYKRGTVHVQVSNPTLSGAYVSSSANLNLTNNVVTKDFKGKASSSGRLTTQVIQADNLELSASSSAKIEGHFQVANNTAIDVSSSAKVDVELKANKMDIAASSSGKIAVEGIAKTVTAKASSSAKIDGKEMTVKTLEGKASSSGMMSFTVSDEVKGKASSSGKIRVYGSANLVEVTKSSGGKIEKVSK